MRRTERDRRLVLSSGDDEANADDDADVIGNMMETA